MKYPKRAIFPKGEQKRFLELAQKKVASSAADFAQLTGTHVRSLYDWKKERYSISLPALKKICKKSGLSLPDKIKTESPFWYAPKGGSVGGIAVYEKYGYIGGDPANRSKKWREWWEKEGRFKKHPFIGVTKPIKRPAPSQELAEFVGIMIGDGSITKRQLMITLHKDDDADYRYFIKALIQDLFRVPVTEVFYKEFCAVKLVISRIKLVRFCNTVLGLHIGNKLKQGLDVPDWIKNNPKFQTACLRGLIDTDGCIFYERHKIKNKIYSYPRLNFVSFSPQLIHSVYNILKTLGLSAKIRRQGKSVQLENKDEIMYYLKTVGTHNPKHEKRLEEG